MTELNAKIEKAARRPKGNKRAGAVKPVNIKRMLIYAVLAFFAIIFVCTFIDQQISLNQKSKEIDELTEMVEAATKETERLQAEVDNLSDPEYIEKVARERLGLVRPNERVFVDSNKSTDNSGR